MFIASPERLGESDQPRPQDRQHPEVDSLGFFNDFLPGFNWSLSWQGFA
jgi:hypothetical protein